MLFLYENLFCGNLLEAPRMNTHNIGLHAEAEVHVMSN